MLEVGNKVFTLDTEEMVEIIEVYTGAEGKPFCKHVFVDRPLDQGIRPMEGYTKYKQPPANLQVAVALDYDSGEIRLFNWAEAQTVDDFEEDVLYTDETGLTENHTNWMVTNLNDLEAEIARLKKECGIK